jgi:glyoxylase-like metal-dependent hydrolase (beta-lactamase superfamily II)
MTNPYIIMIKSFLRATVLSTAAFSTMALAAPLQLDVYNPGEHAVFPVSSEIIIGKNEVVLIDAQFQRNDAQALVNKIKATGKPLTTVYISHSDPDYYFGLDVIAAAFPQAKIVATKETVAAIEASKDGKLAYWGPILKENAPGKIIVPVALTDNRLSVEGQSLEIKGPVPARTFVWIPALKAVVGGVAVSANIHAWIADTQTVQSRRDWIKTLDAIKALKPKTVIPGHYLPNANGTAPNDMQAVTFTRSYIQQFEQEAGKANNADALVHAMKKHYPELGEPSSLELSAKVLKGEMKWP